jgi:GAF domain-containing protein
MTLENSERWKQLCTLIGTEQDPNRLMQMVGELVEELDKKGRPSASQVRNLNPRAQNPYEVLRGSPFLPKFVASAIRATHAKFGTMQLLDSSQNVLRLVAHHGFERDFVDYFDTVREDSSCSCGSAMGVRSRIVVTDVATDPIFEKTREVMLRANVRACQSTPLVNRAGELMGMVSTHFDENRGLSVAESDAMDELAARFAEGM